MALLSNNEVMLILKPILKISNSEQDPLLDILISETIQRVANYINQPPPIELKYAVARIAAANYKTNFTDNGGNNVAKIKEDQREVEFESSGDSPDSFLKSLSVDVRQDLMRFRKMPLF